MPCIKGSSGKVSEVHTIIGDLSGYAAVLGYTDGGILKFYHGRQDNVVTNIHK